MTTLYKPVLIESVEQAEALPVGTLAYWNGWAYVREDFGDLVGWSSGYESALDEHLIGGTALVPIEAEEERRTLDLPEMLGGARNAPVTRLVTPWEAV